MSENAQLPIPKDILEPYLRQAVATSITQLMGDKGQQLILSAVQSALSAKVDASNGHPSKYNSNSDIPFVEYLARSTIQKIALETVNSMAQDLRPEIEKSVKQTLTKSTNALSKTLVDGMIKSLSSQWHVKLIVNEN